MGARPTRSSISENLNSIVSKSYLNFTAECHDELKEVQLIQVNPRLVTFVSPQGFPVTMNSSAGCLACQQKLLGGIVAGEYEAARFYFPDVGEGDPNEIDRYRTMCNLVCADVWVTGLQQESNTRFEGECAVTNDTHAEFINQCTASIFQSLESNSDFLTAIVGAFGGEDTLETRNIVQSKMEQELNVNILAQMNFNLVNSQEFRIANSNSVYSSGISQQLLVDVCKSVLISNNFANRMLQDTQIDEYTEVENDSNTLAAALAAIEEINRAFANAVGGGISLLAVLIGLLIAGASIMFLAIVIHIMAEKKKAELAALCPDLPQVSTLQMLRGQVREAKQLQAELKA
jgi:hypothetical protein